MGDYTHNEIAWYRSVIDRSYNSLLQQWYATILTKCANDQHNIRDVAVRLSLTSLRKM